MTTTEAKPSVDYQPPPASHRSVWLFAVRVRDLIQNWDLKLVILLGLGIALVFGVRDFLVFWHLTHPGSAPTQLTPTP